MPRRSILVVSYYYPPDKSVGGNRWAAMVPHLRAAGHDVTVLTTNAAGTMPDDDGRVVRTTDLQASDGLRRLLRRPERSDDGGKGGAVSAAPADPPVLLNQGLVPDAHVATWLPGAVRAARRIVRDGVIDCVITSAPPDSVALLPLFLGKQRPAWIADFRDGWRFEPLRGDWPTSAQEDLDRRVERRVARTAEVVVGATRPIARDFADRLGADAHHVPNAWDPALDDAVGAATLDALDPARLNLVHTGQLSGPRGRDPRPFFEAMRRVVDARGSDGERLNLVLVGGLDDNEQSMLRDLDIERLVQPLGQRSRMEAVGYQRASDAVVLLTSPGHRSQATGKLYEYLASGRPILALADDNEAARIIDETHTGATMAPDDVPAIAEALERLLDDRLDTAPTGLERYRFPAPADEFGELVERAISARSTS